MSDALLTISADYSVDELDALADAFGATGLATGDAADPVTRARRATALRGLVARRAIALDGTASAPRIELLEPHGTLLGTVLAADRSVSVTATATDGVRRWVVFRRGDVAVEQHARPAQPAILRMTAHPAERSTTLISEPLGALAERVRDDYQLLAGLGQGVLLHPFPEIGRQVIVRVAFPVGYA